MEKIIVNAQFGQILSFNNVNVWIMGRNQSCSFFSYFPSSFSPISIKRGKLYPKISRKGYCENIKKRNFAIYP